MGKLLGTSASGAEPDAGVESSHEPGRSDWLIE